MTQLNIQKWNDFKFDLKSQTQENIITENIIRISLLALEKNLNTINQKIENKHLVIFFKVITKNQQFRTISNMQTIDLKDFNKLNPLFIEYWRLKSEEYYIADYSAIIYTYKIIEHNKAIETRINNPPVIQDIIILSTPFHTFKGYNLPCTMDFYKWGNVQWINDDYVIVYKSSSSLEYHITIFENHYIVDLKLEDRIVLSFKDEIDDTADLTSFTRTVKNQTYIFQDGLLILKKKNQKVEFLSRIKRNIYNSKKWITMDLETRVVNGIMTAYCVSLYDGKNFKSFYLTEYKDDKSMLKESILYLMKRKYHGYKIYLHNFSNFDAIFLLNILSSLSDKIKPIIKDGRFINLQFKFADKYTLYFRDSYLLLPSSLRKLAIDFNVTNKGIFPYKFVNSNIELNYEGSVPNYDFFENISLSEYNDYCEEFNQNSFINWSLKTETIKYCEQDCLVLYLIIDKFSDYIFNLFRIDILVYPTLSSLAFAIYRSKFLFEDKIPLIHGEMYNFIKKAYTGGSVDVFKPHSSLDHINSKVYRYDVNSLYPYVMKEYPMPVGTPIFFEGNILNIPSYMKNKPFGIFEVDVNCPEDMNIPILQTRIKTEKGYRTIAPVGTWNGYYFSDELYNAAKYGYTFTVKRGYLFEKGNIFSGYVDFLYELKKNSNKDSPNYIISKLLLNSLYGRLGMNPYSDNHIILNNNEAISFYSDKTITNVIDLQNGKELISYNNLNKDFKCESNNSSFKNISVVVSAVVTASARIYMSQFKTNKSYTLYYSDTDSIDISKELDSCYIGKELGLMKLEHIFEEAVFLAPKMYGGITKDYEYVKIKGLKNPIKFEELKSLLYKDSKLEIKQEKWYSDISNGIFHIKDEIYTLMITDKKRKLIYDKNKFINTKPIKLYGGIIIN